MSQKFTLLNVRDDVERPLKAILHREKRDDIHVQVAYLVTLKIDDEVYVNTVVEPWTHFGRLEANKVVKAAIAHLDKQELEREDRKEAQSDVPDAVREALIAAQPDNQIGESAVSAELPEGSGEGDSVPVANAGHFEMRAETGIYTSDGQGNLT